MHMYTLSRQISVFMSTPRRKESDYNDESDKQTESSGTVKIFLNRGSGSLIQLTVIHSTSDATKTEIAKGAWQLVSESFPTLGV